MKKFLFALGLVFFNYVTNYSVSVEHKLKRINNKTYLQIFSSSEAKLYPIDVENVNELLGEEKVSLLMIASAANDIDAVQYLINHGADVDHKDLDGGNALLWACEANADIRLIKLLLDAGADVNVIWEEEGFLTPLYFAIIHEHEELIQLLLASGAEIESWIDTAIELLEEELEDKIFDENQEVFELLVKFRNSHL